MRWERRKSRHTAWTFSQAGRTPPKAFQVLTSDIVCGTFGNFAHLIHQVPSFGHRYPPPTALTLEPFPLPGEQENGHP